MLQKICVIYIKGLRWNKYFSKVAWGSDHFLELVTKSLHNIYKSYIERKKNIKENVKA